MVAVLKWGSRQIGPRYFSFFSILFYQLWGVHLIQKCHAIRAFAIIFLSNFGGASYTQVRLIHRRIRYCVGWDAVLGGLFLPQALLGIQKLESVGYIFTGFHRHFPIFLPYIVMVYVYI